MFIDFLPMLLLNMAAGLFNLAHFVYSGLDSENKKNWAPGFLISGLIATIGGFYIVFVWPLPGSYNIAFGELSVLLGAVFLGAAFALVMNYELHSVTTYGFFGGLASIVTGVRIINLQMTSGPYFSGTGFILTGLCGIMSSVALCYRSNKVIRNTGTVVIVIAAMIWTFTGVMGLWGHLESFSKWTPHTMQQAQIK